MEHLATKEPAVSLGFRLKPGQGKNIEIQRHEWKSQTIGGSVCISVSQSSIIKCLKVERTQLETAKATFEQAFLDIWAAAPVKRPFSLSPRCQVFAQ